jgi:hypothetical protein
LDLHFAIHRGRRGKNIANWVVICRGVHEVKLDDFDGGGINVHGGDHPAARQHRDPSIGLRWKRDSDQSGILMTLYEAHVDAVDDWIPFERYLMPPSVWRRGFEQRSRQEFGCEGPRFLIRAYANALRASGEPARLVLPKRRAKCPTPKLLHFGSSYVVADEFIGKLDVFAPDV